MERGELAPYPGICPEKIPRTYPGKTPRTYPGKTPRTYPGQTPRMYLGQTPRICPRTSPLGLFAIAALFAIALRGEPVGVLKWRRGLASQQVVLRDWQCVQKNQAEPLTKRAHTYQQLREQRVLGENAALPDQQECGGELLPTAGPVHA